MKRGSFFCKEVLTNFFMLNLKHVQYWLLNQVLVYQYVFLFLIGISILGSKRRRSSDDEEYQPLELDHATGEFSASLSERVKRRRRQVHLFGSNDKAGKESSDGDSRSATPIVKEGRVMMQILHLLERIIFVLKCAVLLKCAVYFF